MVDKFLLLISISEHDSSQWKNATDSDCESLLKNHIWDLAKNFTVPNVSMSMTVLPDMTSSRVDENVVTLASF